MRSLATCEQLDVRRQKQVPLSNSGRLKALIAEVGENYSFDLDIRHQRDVDRELYGKDHVITSDSIILDHCVSWVNLLSACVARTGADVLKVWDDSVISK